MAKNIKKIITHKSGKFVFSHKYDTEVINALIVQCAIKYETIKDIPILPDFASNLDEELMIRSIFSTAAIEDNHLSEQDVKNIVLNNVEAKNEKQQEIINLKKLYKRITLMKNLGKSQNLINVGKIKDIQRIITQNINYPDNVPGAYRKHKVRVGDNYHGGVYTPPKILDDIKMLLDVFVGWVNSDELMKESNFIRAILAHLYLALIHPFGQGNGRAARSIEGLILQSTGIKYLPKMLSNYYYKNIDEYYWSFSNTIKSLHKENGYDVTPFLSFVLKGIIELLDEIKREVYFYIRALTLKTYFAEIVRETIISKRQHYLLNILLESGLDFKIEELFTQAVFKVLYSKLSYKTAQRDLKHLISLNLINNKNGRYDINMNALN